MYICTIAILPSIKSGLPEPLPTTLPEPEDIEDTDVFDCENRYPSTNNLIVLPSYVTDT